MKVHIVGAGPTGMSLAWEILRSGDHDITIYDRKTSAGGSWWEPTEEVRDLHAHRIVFDKAFVNTQSLFKEMGMRWDDIFEPVQKDIYGFVFRSLTLKDYGTLTSLAARVLTKPKKYKGVSLKEALGPLSESGQRLIRASPPHHGWGHLGCHVSVGVCQKF
jgi:cation diffusion facilitator CzcD-associated flavoprotein CzcO